MDSQAGKTFVITGATNGIGKVAALELARSGARVLLVGRDAARTQTTVHEIQKATGSQVVESALCDFSEPAKVKALAAELSNRVPKLDVLINNAGAINDTRQTNSLGWEVTFAVNHLGYFLLTSLLLSRLKESAPARIVNVASNAHRGGRMNFDDLQLTKGWNQFAAYQQSKLANILFTRELARRLEGSRVTANSLHPGLIASGFGLNNRGIIWRVWSKIGTIFSKTSEQGAQTILHAATAKELDGISGRYYVDCKEAQPIRRAQSDEDASRLWDISEKLLAAYL